VIGNSGLPAGKRGGGRPSSGAIALAVEAPELELPAFPLLTIFALGGPLPAGLAGGSGVVLLGPLLLDGFAVLELDFEVDGALDDADEVFCLPMAGWIRMVVVGVRAVLVVQGAGRLQKTSVVRSRI